MILRLLIFATLISFHNSVLLLAQDTPSPLEGETVASAPRADEAAAPNSIHFKTEQAIVFKDGYTLLLKRGTARTNDDGQIFSNQVPESAVLGSFWAIPSHGKMLSMKAGWISQEETVDAVFPCTSTIDLLLANLGQLATIHFEKKEFSGTIRQVLTQQTYEHLNSWDDLEARLAPDSKLIKREIDSVRITTLTGIQFILKTEAGALVLPISDVKSIQIEEIASTITRTLKIQSRKKQLTFQFENPNQEQELTLMYFRPGMRWIPTYRMQLAEEQQDNLQDNSSATIALQAELINEMEDLEDVPIKIVVGVPHFRFKDSTSPFALESVLRNVANGRGSGRILLGQQISNARFSNGITADLDNPFGSPAAEQFAEVPDTQFNLGGEQSHDLFVYSLPNLTIKKGDRMAVPVFTEKSTYQNVYTWDLKIARSDIETSPSSNYGKSAINLPANLLGGSTASPLQFSLNKVWHQLDLRNETAVPWTTGPIMLLQGWQPISQDLLTYTPAKSRVRVPVTIAIDLQGTFDEKETDRNLNSLKWDRQSYAKITKQAEVKLINHKQKPIRVEIKVRLGGKVTQCSADGKIKLLPYDAADWQNYRGSPAVNNSSLVTWTVELKPGESFHATVDYHYYARQ